MAGFADNYINALMAGAQDGNRARMVDMQAQRQNALLPLEVQQAQIGMQAQRQGMAIDAERLAMAREAGKREAAAFAQDAARRAQFEQEFRFMQQGARAYEAAKSGDTRAFETWRRMAGPDGEAITLETFPAYMATAEGGMEMLQGLAAAQEFSNPAPQGFRPATPEEAARYGATAGQIDQGTGRFHPINPPSGVSATVGPDGTVQFAQGPGVQAKPFTEAQSKDNVFTVRAEGALTLLDSVGAEALASRTDRVLDAVPLGIGREAQGEKFQVAQQAGNEFLQAILRKDTGAAITPGEQDLYGKTYLPQPGDGAAVIEAKRGARIRALEALKSGASVQQLTAQQRALVEAARKADETRPAVAAAPEAAGSPTMPTRLRFNPETGELE